MADPPDCAVRRRRCGAPALLVGWSLASLGLAGCFSATASPPRASTPAPRLAAPASPEVLAAWADLLRLEDRRDYQAELLQSYAADSTPLVRRRTALALGRLRRTEGGAMLLRLLQDADSGVAATAAFALGQLGDSTHASALAQTLATASADGRVTVASEAAYALGKTGGSMARSALLDALAGSAVRPAGEGTSPVPLSVVNSALLAVWRLPPPSDLAPISRWLRSPDAELRSSAAYALSRRPDARALPLLRAALADPDPRVRSSALRGLSAPLADSAGVSRAELLGEILPHSRDPEYVVAVNAIRVLGSYDDARAVHALMDIATAADPHRTFAAIESLGRIGASATEAAPALVTIARLDSVPVALRAAAVDALGEIDPAAAQQVASGVTTAADWRLRAAAARVGVSTTLEGGDPAGLEPLLSDADPRVANAALQAAIDAAGDSLLPLRSPLLERLGSPDAIVRATALTALQRIAEPSLLPAFLDAFARAQADTLNDAALAAVDAIAATRRDDFDPARAFFARFQRSGDALVRLRVAERFDSTRVADAWGSPLPIDTGLEMADYRRLVDRWVAPALAGAPPPTADLVTEGDTIRIRLFPLDATLTVESFASLSRSGYFDGQRWPRVVPNFVVQGGDPRGDTSGGPGYTLRDEINRHRYGVGTLGMALAGPDTGGSQFFITHSSQPHLDGIYAVFGQVTDGQEVAERLLPGQTIDSIRTTP